tara:strand:- start:138 stop:392 length:255 start_codon:yes stop_codon:yes gene_type:complete
MKYSFNSFKSNTLIQIFQIEMDIIIYKVVQTGANTQLGGLKLDKIISEYQGSLKEAVVKPPIADAIKVIKSIKNRDKYLFLVIY